MLVKGCILSWLLLVSACTFHAHSEMFALNIKDFTPPGMIRRAY